MTDKQKIELFLAIVASLGISLDTSYSADARWLTFHLNKDHNHGKAASEEISRLKAAIDAKEEELKKEDKSIVFRFSGNGYGCGGLIWFW